MAGTVTRRPLPALVALLALLLLTALVWWRVSSRDTSSPSAAKTSCPTPTPSAAASPSTLPPPSSIQIAVLNATSRAGIAAKARSAFLKLGFQSPTPASNDQSAYRTKVTGGGQIRYTAANKDAARLLTYYLPGASLLPVPGTSPTVTVALGPKFSAVASQHTVSTALAAAHVSISSSAPTAPAAAPSASPTC